MFLPPLKVEAQYERLQVVAEPVPQPNLNGYLLLHDT